MVRTKSRVLFDSMCFTVSGVNEKGPFDILPLHANFVTLVYSPITVDKGRQSEKQIDLKEALVDVVSNNVNVYIEE